MDLFLQISEKNQRLLRHLKIDKLQFQFVLMLSLQKFLLFGLSIQLHHLIKHLQNHLLAD